MSKEDEFITRDDLRDYIHSIHNFIRNNGAGYGQTGVKIFSVFYGLKLIQPKLKDFGLTKEQEEKLDFNVLVKKALKAKKDKDNTCGMTSYIDDNVLEELYRLKSDKSDKNHNLGHFIFHQIPRDLKDNVWVELILKINRIPVGYKKERKANLSGKVWEYFVGRDSTAISELGAYFTDRHITDFIFNKLQPKLNKNNDIPSMIDPFGGSGGFTLGYANYMREKYNNIKWEKNVNNIYHFDMEESVVNMSGLEMFAITDYFPDRKNNFNFTRVNTFTNDFIGKENISMKYDYIISNPPYGGDKINKNAEQIKREKLIDYIKNINDDESSEELKEQLKDLVKETNEYKKEQENQQVKLNNCSKRIKDFAKKYKLDTANDKEACSLILLMDMLAENGTCCGVLKEGVFFDGKYSKLRQILIENFNVTDVISVPQNAFENTSTKTSIVIFHNNGKTKKINFSELVVEVEEEDVIEIKEDGKAHMINNKDEINRVVENQICVATYKQLAEPTIIKSKGKKVEERERFDYSLNYKNYKDYKVFCPEGYELKKLDELVKFNGKSKRLAEFANETGKYRYYSSGGKILKCDTADFINEPSIIIGHSGNGCIFIDNEFSTLVTNHVLQTNNKLLLNYIYNYIDYNWNIFFDQCYKGSTVKNTSEEEIKKFIIPIPKDLTKLKKPLESLQQLHQQITQDTESIPQKEKAICDKIKELTDKGKEGVDYDSHKLGDEHIFKIIYGTRITKGNNIIGKIPVYGGGDITFYTDKANFHGSNILISRFGNCIKEKCTKIVKGDIFLNDSGFTIITSDPLILSNDLLIYTIKLYNDIIYDYKQGSAQLNMNMERLRNQMIKVLKPSVMKKNKLQEMFDEVEQLKETLENNKKEYQKQMDKLFEQFKDNNDEPNDASNDEVNDKADESDDEATNEVNIEAKIEQIIDDTNDKSSKKSKKKLSKKIQTIEIKGKTYILEEDKVFKIDDDGNKGKQYGTYLDGKVKKLKSEEKEVSI